MKKTFVLLALCALGCSPSGNSNQPGQQPAQLAGLLAQALPGPAQQAQQPQQAQQAPAPPVEPAQVQPPEPAAPEPFPQAEASPAAPAQPQPAEMAPVQRPSDQGNADVCSAMCDRIASCRIATKEACMPVCGPQMPQLTPEQRTQVISVMSSMPCEDMARFGAQEGNASPGAAGQAQPMVPEAQDGDDDGKDS